MHCSKQAENWRVTHADDPDLLITLARFQLELKARDKALLLLVEAARIGVSGETYMELGLLLESMGESAKALQCYRRGLQESHASPVPEPSRHLFRVVTGCGGKPVAHAVPVQYNTI